MAAPKKDPKLKKNSKLEVKVTDDFKAEVLEFAEKKGIPYSSLVILWLRERMDQEKSG